VKTDYWTKKSRRAGVRAVALPGVDLTTTATTTSARSADAVFVTTRARSNSNPGGGQYDRRVAKTIREAVYDEAPELEPVEYAD